MADIEFDGDGEVRLLTRHHGYVTLTRGNWETHICVKPERYYYRLNGEKVATTLIAPDTVRCHAQAEHQFIYYKHFRRWQVVAGVDASIAASTMAVVIDEVSRRGCTVYPVIQPKPGKEFRP